MYDFNKQLKAGRQGEKELDRYFGRWYRVRPAARSWQRLGIDRLFECKRTGRCFTVEYKADTTAAQTGNAFIETVSVDASGKKGWAYTSLAQILVYYIPPAGLVYIIPMTTIRHNLPEWRQKYRTMPIPNNGYRTHGLCVPLDAIEPCAIAILRLEVNT